MSNYFFINHSTDLRIIGEYPQVEHISHECHLSLSTPRSLKKLVSWRFPEEPPFMDYLILHQKAKLTDVLSFGMISAKGFLVSERFKNLLEQFNIMPHGFYPAKIEYKGTFFNYYFFHLVSQSYDIVDFEKSKFYISSIGLEKIDTISIKNEYELLDAFKQYDIAIEKLYFSNSTLSSPYDVFYLRALHFHIFISQKLKSAIEVMDITGLDSKEQNIIE